MCTVSVLPRPGGYLLRMNRDERCERLDAGRLSLEAARAWPIDPISGGTWIGVNEQGLTLALLNRYPAGQAGPGRRSRGELIPRALRASEASAALALADGEELGAFAPFQLLAFGTSGPWRSLYWNGIRSRKRAWPRVPRVWTSSSVGGWRVLTARRRAFPRPQAPWPVDPWSGVHASHQGLGSICVHRDKGGTISTQEVVATSEGTILLHRPGPACGTGRFHRVKLPRVPAASHAV